MKPLLQWGKINDAANILFLIAVILLKTKAGKTISTLLLSAAPDLWSTIGNVEQSSEKRDWIHLNNNLEYTENILDSIWNFACKSILTVLNWPQKYKNHLKWLMMVLFHVSCADDPTTNCCYACKDLGILFILIQQICFWL